MKNLKITVIGAGALGKAMAFKLKKYGFRLVGIASRKAAQAKIKNFCEIFSPDEAYKNNSDVYILAVPDKAIKNTARNIIKHNKKTILIHLSGCLSSDILRVNNDCVAASCHPIGSFKNFDSSLKTLQNAHWTLEGDKAALEFMKSFVKKLSGNYYIINKKHKALYHSACTLASSGLLSLIYASHNMLKETKLSSKANLKVCPTNILWPLITSSLNNLKEKGFPCGLTGPWTRGDKKTIIMHKDALKNYDKNALKLYNLLSTRYLD